METNLNTQMNTQLDSSRADAQLGNLRALTNVGAKSGQKVPASELHETSRQFESVFVRQLLKVMRETVPESDFLDSGMAGNVYSGMLDDRLANVAAEGGGIGLEPMIFEALAETVRNNGGQVVDETGAVLPGPARVDPRVAAYHAVGPREARVNTEG